VRAAQRGGDEAHEVTGSKLGVPVGALLAAGDEAHEAAGDRVRAAQRGGDEAHEVTGSKLGVPVGALLAGDEAHEAAGDRVRAAQRGGDEAHEVRRHARVRVDEAQRVARGHSGARVHLPPAPTLLRAQLDHLGGVVTLTWLGSTHICPLRGRMGWEER
jgi:hypothetical protein